MVDPNGTEGTNGTGQPTGRADPAASVVLETPVAPGIVRLTLNRAASRNALDDALVSALHDAVRRLGADESVRVLQIAAAGTAFCAGADLNAMLERGRAGGEANLRDARELASLLLAIRECPKPSVALVQGPAFGGGVGLAAACDVALAGPDAKFRLPEVQLGIVPAVISPYVVEAIGLRQARRWFLSGEPIDAARACALGLVHEVTDALDARGLELAAALAAGGPGALAACKALLADVGHTGPSPAAAERTAGILARLREGAEAQEGLRAALARRAPAWRS